MTKHIKSSRKQPKQYVLSGHMLSPFNKDVFLQKDNIVAVKMYLRESVCAGKVTKAINGGFADHAIYEIELLQDSPYLSMPKGYIVQRNLRELYHINKKGIKILKKHNFDCLIQLKKGINDTPFNNSQPCPLPKHIQKEIKIEKEVLSEYDQTY